MANANLNRQNYNPLKDPIYMSDQMQQYFKDLLVHELEDLLEQEQHLLENFPQNIVKEPDFVDESLMESLRFNHRAYQENEHYLRQQVEDALERLADGSYGYCVATKKPIGVERLLAMPYAVYCLDVQEAREDFRAGRWVN